MTLRAQQTGQTLNEPWARFQEKPAVAWVYELWFGASFIKEYHFASVDGARAMLPYPDPARMTITNEQVAIANAVDELGTESDQWAALLS